MAGNSRRSSAPSFCGAGLQLGLSWVLGLGPPRTLQGGCSGGSPGPRVCALPGSFLGPNRPQSLAPWPLHQPPVCPHSGALSTPSHKEQNTIF